MSSPNGSRRTDGGAGSDFHDPELRAAAVAAYRADFPDFGLTPASEKLAERGLVVPDETLRKWLVEEGLWPRKRRSEKHRRRRRRRECFGEPFKWTHRYMTGPRVAAKRWCSPS